MIFCHMILHYITILITLHYIMILFCIILYYVVCNCIIFYHLVLFCSILYHITFYYFSVYCIASSSIIPCWKVDRLNVHVTRKYGITWNNNGHDHDTTISCGACIGITSSPQYSWDVKCTRNQFCIDCKYNICSMPCVYHEDSSPSTWWIAKSLMGDNVTHGDRQVLVGLPYLPLYCWYSYVTITWTISAGE